MPDGWKFYLFEPIVLIHRWVLYTGGEEAALLIPTDAPTAEYASTEEKEKNDREEGRSPFCETR